MSYNNSVKGFEDQVPERWRLLDLSFDDPLSNLALEESILLSVEKGLAPNTLRLWSNSKAVVLGQQQCPDSAVNVDACREYRIPVVRRFTGGGAVYQDNGNLNWTFVLRKRSTIPTDVTGIFKFFSASVVGGLKSLGMNAVFSPPNRIDIHRKKISGMAAYVKRGSILCHGTLLVSTDLKILSEICYPKDYMGRLVKVTSIAEQLRRNVRLQEVKNAIIQSVVETYQVSVQREGLAARAKIPLVDRLEQDPFGTTHNSDFVKVDADNGTVSVIKKT